VETVDDVVVTVPKTGSAEQPSPEFAPKMVEIGIQAVGQSVGEEVMRWRVPPRLAAPQMILLSVKIADLEYKTQSHLDYTRCGRCARGHAKIGIVDIHV
jgi:hypothetical protein